MSYTIPPDSPKAVIAATFGRELIAACKRRGIPLSEVERSIGVGHTALDNYRRGLVLPRTETARALAAVLNAPHLATLVERYRTHTCARKGCPKTFRNDTGAPRKFCSLDCQRINEKLKNSTRHARRAGQTDDRRSRNASMNLLRSGLKIADERVALLESAIAGMCVECEPERICRTPECPLRPFSPLPLAKHDLQHEPRTLEVVRQGRWAAPGAREAFSEQIRQRHAAGLMPKPVGFTDEQRAKAIATVRSPEGRQRASIAGKARWDRERAKREQAS